MKKISSTCGATGGEIRFTCIILEALDKTKVISNPCKKLKLAKRGTTRE